MKAIIVKQWEELSAIENSAELYKIFIRVLQVLSAIALLVQVVIFIPAIAQSAFDTAYGINPMVFAFPIVLTFGQILLLQYASKLIEQGKFRGTLIGIVLSLMCIPSLYIPLGIFGLYCFLNPGYQRKHLASAPKPFVDFLQLVGIDYVTAENASPSLEDHGSNSKK
ncbi:MAG: hypothetical protein EOP06_22300 [Proteobacteria bacterium]|nr:MAG: hypothetical protein EOP06_22300 [Pseudomonadota bacterium]